MFNRTPDDGNRFFKDVGSEKVRKRNICSKKTNLLKHFRLFFYFWQFSKITVWTKLFYLKYFIYSNQEYVKG